MNERRIEALSPRPDRSLLVILDEIVRGRRSVRRYRADPVPRALLESVLAAAACAPSPHHSAPWRFVVLTREERRAALAEAMGQAWRRDLAGDGLPAERITVLVERSRERLLGAPVLIVLCVTTERADRYPDARRQQAERLMFAHSVGAALQNAMLAAHAAGLASCWMCAPLFCGEVVTACLGFDPGLQPQALLTLGYAADPVPARPPIDPSGLVALWD
jgi:coenzyme F420-0:L-glutamate ligase/coenzyme F420-1:gamma-L-glutamate ligase